MTTCLLECIEMSDCDKSSSSEEDLLNDDGETTHEIVNPIQKCCYFLTETGHSLNFVLLADNMSDSEVTEATELIQVSYVPYCIISSNLTES